MHKRNAYRSITVKRHLARQHFIKHNTKRIYIASCIGKAAPCLFRGNIMNTSQSTSAYNGCFARNCSCDTEVCNLKDFILCHKNILRLYVTVYNIYGMCLIYTLSYLNGKVTRLLPRKSTPCLYVFFKGYTVHIFHNHVVKSVFFAHIINGYYVVMHKTCR